MSKKDDVSVAIKGIREALDWTRDDELKPVFVVRSSITLRTCPADIDRIERLLATIEESIEEAREALR